MLCFYVFSLPMHCNAQTNSSTVDPTYEPSPPTDSPTKDPTVIPTTDPTVSPTVDPTTNPTADPTTLYPLVTDSIQDFFSSIDIWEDVVPPEDESDDVQFIYVVLLQLVEIVLAHTIILAFVVVLLLCLLLLLIACCFHLPRRGSDSPDYMAIFKFFITTGDYYSDLIWTVTLYLEGDSLWIYAASFTVGPHLLSIAVALFFTLKWSQSRSREAILEYAKKYDTLIVALSMISGFYAATDLITSHLFHLSALSLPLSNQQRARINSLKMLNENVLENIPCLCIQCLYIYRKSNGELSFDSGADALGSLNVSSITFVAMTFGAVNVLRGFLSCSIRTVNCCIDFGRGDGDHLNKV